MLINPHVTCAKVLDTLKYSGLTYTLNETPYSVYLTVRKKFTKEYSPSQHTSEQDTVDCKDTLAQLLQEEIANHNLTRQELAQKDEQLGIAVDANNQNIEESRHQHFLQVNTINNLTKDLAQEVAEHTQAEHAIRKLEEKLENLETRLEKEVKDKQDKSEEIESLHEKLEDAEQEIKNSHELIKKLNAKTLHYEFKQAELASMDVAVLKAKVTDLEGTITGKDRLISSLKDQAQLSLKEITELRQSTLPASDIQNMPKSDNPSHHDTSLHPHLPHPSSSPDTPIPSSLQSDTSTPDVQPPKILRSHMKVTTVDQNFNLPIIESSQNFSLSYNETLESSPHSSTPPATSVSPFQHSSPGPEFSRNSETFCQNCKNELPDDFNVILPPPVYFYDFLAECPSPWLHYGYCTPCLVVARFTNNTSITEHIAQCPALLDQCWDGEHEDHISEYKEKEAELANSGLNRT